MKYIVTINNNEYEVEVEQGKVTLAGSNETAIGTVKTIDGKLINPVDQAKGEVAASGTGELLKAPMPGTILDIRLNQGARVKKGDVLFILEAMKMENEITADKDGVLAQISVTKGALVATNDVLALIQ
jgi:biotin carboxyl carrier protein